MVDELQGSARRCSRRTFAGIIGLLIVAMASSSMMGRAVAADPGSSPPASDHPAATSLANGSCGSGPGTEADPQQPLPPTEHGSLFDPSNHGATIDIGWQARHPPEYPPEARKANTTGTVIVLVLVCPDSSIGKVVVESSKPSGVFDAATVSAAMSWKFGNAIKDGKPVADWVRVPVVFNL